MKSFLLKLRFLIWVVLIAVAFATGGELGIRWGYKDAEKEFKPRLESSLELYNLGETKYILLAQEIGPGQKGSPEFVERMWNIKTRQDELLSDITEFAKKHGIDIHSQNIPLKKE